MSACDTCPVPGHCCRAIVLGGGRFAQDAKTIEEVGVVIEAYNRQGALMGPNDKRPHHEKPLPFRPLFKRSDGVWSFWCPNLNVETGRCDDYDNRPFACWHYQPGADALCVLYVEPEPQ